MQILKTESIQKIHQGNLEFISIDNPFCSATISYYGAQVLKFYSKNKSKDLLWLSELNQYQHGKAIRGGVPLCFPWFGGHPTQSNFPAHGFARNSIWTLSNIIEDATGHHLQFELTDSENTRLYWNYAFKLEMYIHCGETLHLELKLRNWDIQDFEFSFAWHSYFPIQTKNAKVKGLQGMNYIDQLDGNRLKIQQNELIKFTAELDRIYPNTSGIFSILENDAEQIKIQSTAKSTVIWNPWIEKAQRLGDIHDDAWQDFICVETGQISTKTVKIKAGQSISYQLEISD